MGLAVYDLFNPSNICQIYLHQAIARTVGAPGKSLLFCFSGFISDVFREMFLVVKHFIHAANIFNTR
jgi:hypothetical protein